MGQSTHTNLYPFCVLGVVGLGGQKVSDLSFLALQLLPVIVQGFFQLRYLLPQLLVRPRHYSRFGGGFIKSFLQLKGTEKKDVCACCQRQSNQRDGFLTTIRKSVLKGHFSYRKLRMSIYVLWHGGMRVI